MIPVWVFLLSQSGWLFTFAWSHWRAHLLYRAELDRLIRQRDALLERLHPEATGALLPTPPLTDGARVYGSEADEYEGWLKKVREAGRDPEEAYVEDQWQ